MRKTHLLITTVAVAVAGALSLNPAAAQAAPTKAAPAGAAAVQPSLVPDGSGLDARAAARHPGLTSFAEDSFFSGTLAAGGQQHWIWNNAGTNIVYRVGFAPAGASTTVPCQFEAVDQWYEGLRTGERKFHFVIRNVGGISCGATIELSAVSAATTRSTGGINPGQSLTFSERNIDENSVYLVGLSPSGATTTSSCQLKVVDTFYDKEHKGDVAIPANLFYTVQNVGSITCAANVEVGSNPVESVLSELNLAPGAQASIIWNNANPTTAVHLIGVLLTQPGCFMEITRTWYQQFINPDGSTQRKLRFVVKNTDTVTCSGRPTLSRI